MRFSWLSRSLSLLALVAAPACALDGELEAAAGEDVAEAEQAASFGATIPGVTAGVAASKISVGQESSCLLTPTGDVRCWGKNQYGELGRGSVGGHATTAGLVSGLSGMVDVDAGYYNSCAVRGTDGVVQCWGWNSNAELGPLPAGARATPVTIPGLAGADAVSIGGTHACATVAGNVFCWGSDYQIPGGANTDNVTVPRQITRQGAPLGDTIALAASPSATCAVDWLDANACWGSGLTAQFLGEPTALQPLASRPLDVDVGNAHACAIVYSSSGSREVHCFGQSTYGQAGSYFPSGSVAPPSNRVPAGTGAVQVATGAQHSCALLGDGTAWCWGANGHGQLGNGTTALWLPPVKVQLTGITAIAAGGGNTCAIAGGVAHCWGRNDYGQVGDGTTTMRTRPVKVQLPPLLLAP